MFSSSMSEENEAILVNEKIVKPNTKESIQIEEPAYWSTASYDHELYNISKSIGKFKAEVISKYSERLFVCIRDVSRRCDQEIADIIEHILAFERNNKCYAPIKAGIGRMLRAYIKKLNPSKYIIDLLAKY